MHILVLGFGAYASFLPTWVPDLTFPDSSDLNWQKLLAVSLNLAFAICQTIYGVLFKKK